MIDWEVYGTEELSWEPMENIHDPDLMKAFHETHPEKPCPVAVREPNGRGDDVRILFTGLGFSRQPSFFRHHMAACL